MWKGIGTGGSWGRVSRSVYYVVLYSLLIMKSIDLSIIEFPHYNQQIRWYFRRICVFDIKRYSSTNKQAVLRINLVSSGVV